jgi:diaminopimelate epimerase
VTIDTLGGRLHARRAGQGRIAVLFEPPRFAWRDIPLARPVVDTREVAGVAAAEAAGLGPGVAVNVGNPHIVYFVADPAAIDLPRLGAAIERDPMFPERVNVSFAALAGAGPDAVRVRVWERGAGATKACGTAACAVAVATARTGRTGRSVTVTLPGGDLAISWRPDGPIEMTGPVTHEFEGRLDLQTGTWSAYA